MPSTNVHAEASVATRTDTAIAAGLGNHLPIGDYSGADYRSAVRFPVPAGWSAWTAITKATLSFYISDHQHVGPKNSSIFVSRMTITAPIWSKGAGSQNCESGFTGANNTQYDDISSTATDRVSFSSGSTANAAKSVDVTAAMRYYWQNGGGTSKPVFVFDNNGAGQYTELWSAQKTGGYDLILTIDYEVQSPPTAPTPTGPGNGSTSQTDQPTFSWTHNDPQGDAQSNAEVRVYDAGGVTLLYTWNPPAGGNQSLVAPVGLLRGTTYQWEVRTSDATAYGPYSAKQSFSIKANPVVSVSSTRKMVWANNGPRLVAEWSSDQPQSQFRVTAPGYDSGIRPGGDQSWVLDTLALTNGVNVPITVQVWNTDSPALTSSAARTFTPRYGSTMHYRRLAAVPVNWQQPVVDATTPAGTTLYIEYGSGGNAGGPSSGWFSSITSVPKSQDLWYRAWFIPNATQTPLLNRIDIPYDSTVAVLDKWGNGAYWPWEPNPPLSPNFSIDTGEAVYGTRSVRCDPVGGVGYNILYSSKFKVRAGRSYTLSGLMRSQGNTGCFFRIQSTTTVFTETDKIETPSVLTDWERYKAPVWVAPADMDIFVSLLTKDGVAGSTAWWDGIKVEESIIATPWNPASVGATVVDAGGVQIDGTKGGLLRYRGTAGGARDIVEGGVNGLRFGGDPEVELASPRASILALGGQADLFKMGTIASGSGGGTAGYWWKAASSYFGGQYWACNFIGTAMMQGQNGPASTAGAHVFVGVYQGDVMGSQPYVNVRVDALGDWQPSDFKVVVTGATAARTDFELWIRTPWPWFAPVFSVNQLRQDAGNGNFITYPNGALVANASAGTAYVGQSWGDISRGNVFPVNPPAMSRFWRTDWGQEFYYAGGRWFTTQLFVVEAIPHFDPALTASSTGRVVIPFALQWSDVYVETSTAAFYVAGGTALSPSHKWAISMGPRSIVIDSGAINIGRRVTVAGDYYWSSYVISYMDLSFTKTGTPGNLLQQVHFYYRGVV